jgi:hypothetical protein
MQFRLYHVDLFCSTGAGDAGGCIYIPSLEEVAQVSPSAHQF